MLESFNWNCQKLTDLKLPYNVREKIIETNELKTEAINTQGKNSEKKKSKPGEGKKGNFIYFFLVILK